MYLNFNCILHFSERTDDKKPIWRNSISQNCPRVQTDTVKVMESYRLIANKKNLQIYVGNVTKNACSGFVFISRVKFLPRKEGPGDIYMFRLYRRIWWLLKLGLHGTVSLQNVVSTARLFNLKLQGRAPKYGIVRHLFRFVSNRWELTLFTAH